MRKNQVLINAEKVYDWVRKRVELPLMRFDHLGSKENFCDCSSKSDDPCRIINSRRRLYVESFLSDKDGEELNPEKKDSVDCTAIPTGKEFIIKTDTGETVLLQEILVTVSGYLVIEIVNSYGFTVCISNPIPFSTEDLFLLCSPEGTRAQCEVTYFKCESLLFCSNKKFDHLDINIVVCIDVLAIGNVKIEIDAKACEERADLPIKLAECPSDVPPPQCPELFPVIQEG